MNFPNIINSACIPTSPPAPDPRCGDPIFALLHPDICASSPFLRIKPGVLLTCALGSVQFEAFTVQDGSETLVSEGVTWSVSDPSVVLIGVRSGNATGIAPGTVTVTASAQGLTATATLTVLPGLNCCNLNNVATMLVVDKSHSMSLQFGSGYSTKQAFADALAGEYAAQTNTQKDQIGLIEFDDSAVLDFGVTPDSSAVSAAAGAIVNSVNKTGIGVALRAAVNALANSMATTKVIVLISDGEDKDTNPDNDPVPIATAFKAAGGIMFTVGVRSHGAAFNLMNAMSTGGFFVNTYPEIVTQALGWIYGLKGYICAGNCAPPGNDYEHLPQLNYSAFANWNVTGHVDLLGPGLFDVLPGNGLYVSLVSNQSPWSGTLTSKSSFVFSAGKSYRLSFFLGGNQRKDLGTQTVTCQVGDGSAFKQVIILPNFGQGFTKYSFNFVPLADVTAQVIISQVGDNSQGSYYGSILSDVLLEDITDSVTMFDDNFDNENLQFVPAACGVSVKPSPITCSDPDGAAFISAASITDSAQQTAVCTLVTSLKSASLWSLFDVIYPFVGGNATAHSFNLKNPSKFQIAWTGGVTHDAGGVTGDGVTGYGNTGFNPAVALGNYTQNSAAQGVYCRTAAPAALFGVRVCFLGTNGYGTANSDIGFYNTSPNQTAGFGPNGLLQTGQNTATEKGHSIISRTAAGNVNLYSPDGTSGAFAQASAAATNAIFYVLAANDQTFGAAEFLPGTLAFAYMGAALSGAQVTTLKGIINAFQTALGRA